MDQRVARLEEEVEVLRTEIAVLRREIARLSESSGSAPSISAVTSVSVGGYTQGSAVGSAVDQPVGSGSAPNTVVSGSQSWSVREAICDEIALWLTRSLNGEHRLSSGRDRINLPSRVWLVARDIEGNVYNPPRIYRQFSSCKALVKRGSDLGDSIFVGLPSQREAYRVIAAAGLQRPTDLFD